MEMRKQYKSFEFEESKKLENNYEIGTCSINIYYSRDLDLFLEIETEGSFLIISKSKYFATKFKKYILDKNKDFDTQVLQIVKNISINDFVEKLPTIEEIRKNLSIDKFKEAVEKSPTIEEIRKKDQKEMVNHPSHYGGDTTYECIKVLKAWNTPEEFVGFCKDNAIKYLCRSGKKDEVLQEYKKAAWYINTLIKYLED